MLHLIVRSIRGGGGLERQAVALAKKLVSRGLAVEVLTLDEVKGEDLGLRVRVLHLQRTLEYFKIIDFSKIWYRERGNGLEASVSLAFDRVIGTDFYRAGNACHKEWMRIRGMRAGFFERFSLSINPKNYIINSIEKKIFKNAIAHKTKIIVLSVVGMQQIQKHYDVPDSAFVIIPPMIDIERFSVSQRRGVDHARGGSGALLFVGSGYRVKGLDRLLRAFSLMDSDLCRKLDVLGREKRNAKRYRKLAKKLGIDDRVGFRGLVDDPTEFYLHAEVFVGLSLLETFNVAAVEALSFGLPVVVSEAMGVAELVRSDSDFGIVVDENETDSEVAIKIEQLLYQERSRSEANKRVVVDKRSSVTKRFIPDRIADQYLAMMGFLDK